MSYILEALKRSEQERELGQVPRLVTSQGTAMQQRPRWMWAVIGVLLINGLLLAGLLIQQRIPDGSVPLNDLTATQDPGTNAATISLDGAKEAAVSVMPSESVSAPSAPVPVDSAPVDPSLDNNSNLSSPASPVMATPPPADSPPEHSDTPQTGTVVFSDQPLDKYSEDSQLGGTVSMPEPSEPAKEQRIPLWQEMPSEFRQALPLVSIDVHVYAEQPKDRFVLVNLLKYREGDLLQEGPRLERISPEGMELSYQGKRFRITK